MFRKAGLYVLYFLSAGLLLTAGLVVYRARPTQDSLRTQVISAGQNVVRQEIDEELRTAFASFDETSVEQLPDDRYRVSGWVDLISEDGNQDRNNFTCVVYRNDNGDWVGEKIAVIPQM